MELAAGSLVDGKYRVVRLLGRGGMGAVYEVENVRVRRSAALKLLPSTTSRDVVARFEAEAQAAGRAGSKRIVDVLDLGRTPDDRPYLVMELLEGETLRDELNRARRLAPRRAAALIADVLKGLEAAHGAGIVHRDLKPENIWVLAAGGAGGGAGGSSAGGNGAGAATTGGDVPLVKILDFGVSKFTAAADEARPKTAAGVMIGTSGYMSPEQVRDARGADARSDIYALGVVLHELLAGTLPFTDASVAEMVWEVLNGTPRDLRAAAPGVPEPLVEIVQRALARMPGDRFPHAAAMHAELCAFLESRPPPQLDLALLLPSPPTTARPEPPTADTLGPADAASVRPPVLERPPPTAPSAPDPPAPPPLHVPPNAERDAPRALPQRVARITLAEPPAASLAEHDERWPRPPLYVGAVAAAVIGVSVVVGVLFRAGLLGG